MVNEPSSMHAPRRASSQVSRGGLVDEVALTAALDSGTSAAPRSTSSPLSPFLSTSRCSTQGTRCLAPNAPHYF